MGNGQEKEGKKGQRFTFTSSERERLFFRHSVMGWVKQAQRED